jgi:hypothetical protein
MAVPPFLFGIPVRHIFHQCFRFDRTGLIGCLYIQGPTRELVAAVWNTLAALLASLVDAV